MRTLPIPDDFRHCSVAERRLIVFLIGEDAFLLGALSRLIRVRRPRWAVEHVPDLAGLHRRLRHAQKDVVVVADASATSDVGNRAVALTRGCHPNIPCVAYVDGFGHVTEKAALAHRLVGGSVSIRLVLDTIEHAVAPEQRVTTSGPWQHTLH